MSSIDLHSHSTASDGTLAPAEVVRLAKERGLSALALTDHDTIGGVAEAATEAKRVGLDFLPGIEISAEFPHPGTLHLLGYGIDPESTILRDLTATLLGGRDNRNPKIVAKLQALNIPITMEEVEAEAGGKVIGRPHIAAILLRKGIVTSMKQAFDKYLAPGGLAYFDKERLSPKQAIRMILDSGGLPVLAHPVQLRCENDAQLERIVKDLVDLGLAGIEVMHSDHSAALIEKYEALADRFHLLKTGGSDFHGANKQIDLGTAAGRKVPRRYYDDLMKALAERKPKEKNPEAQGTSMIAAPEKLDLESLNQMLEGQTPQKIVEWSFAQFGRELVMSSSFGAESAVLIHMANTIFPGIKIIWVNTGYLFPETHVFMEQLRRMMDLNVWIYRTRNDPITYLQQAGEQNPAWRNNIDACCAANKNEPFERAMKELAPPAWLRGIKRGQAVTRADRKVVEWSKRFNTYAISPLLNWGNRETHAYLKQHNLPYHPLWDKGYFSIGCNPQSCTRPVAIGEDPRSGRWADEDKIECGINVDKNSLDSANLQAIIVRTGLAMDIKPPIPNEPLEYALQNGATIGLIRMIAMIGAFLGIVHLLDVSVRFIAVLSLHSIYYIYRFEAFLQMFSGAMWVWLIMAGYQCEVVPSRVRRLFIWSRAAVVWQAIMFIYWFVEYYQRQPSAPRPQLWMNVDSAAARICDTLVFPIIVLLFCRLPEVRELIANHRQMEG